MTRLDAARAAIADAIVELRLAGERLDAGKLRKANVHLFQAHAFDGLARRLLDEELEVRMVAEKSHEVAVLKRAKVGGRPP